VTWLGTGGGDAPLSLSHLRSTCPIASPARTGTVSAGTEGRWFVGDPS
jgi:hypothetical protein